jgi:hypothetical protein
MLLGAWFLLVSPVLAQTHKGPFPRDGAKKVNEGDRVTVWDVTREKGRPTAMYELPLDQVSVTLAEGAVKVTRPDGTSSIEQERFGSVRFESKGTVHSEEGVSDTPSRVIVFQLKDAASPGWPITEGIPGQFPRVGAVKLFETDRIRVWDQTWRAGARISRHLHYVQTAAVFLVGGKLRTMDEGRPPNAPFAREAGDVLGSSRAPIQIPHEEEQVEGSPRAIWIEFK